MSRTAHDTTPESASDAAPEAAKLGDKIRCDACPVMCYVKPGATGACDRYANIDGEIVRVDPHVLLDRTLGKGGALVPFDIPKPWDGTILDGSRAFVTAIGAGTTYPDYKPAPFIVASKIDNADMVTVVTEGIFSYCGVKIKVDTDRHLGPEQSSVRAAGEAVGHVMTGEYGSQMLSLGGVHHLTGGSKKEGRVTCDTMLALCNGQPVELSVDEGATVVVQAGKAPIVNGVIEERMRVGCGSAAIGMFAKQWFGKVDEVVVVDDHITGVLSEHQAGRYLGARDTGIRIKGRRSTPGRYFQVAEPGTGWGGTDISDPLTILEPFDAKKSRPGLTMLMVSTTGEQFAFYRLDEQLRPIQEELPEELRVSVERIRENCEPALCSVLFMGGAGGSLRAGVTENPVLTRSVKDALTLVTCGGAPCYVWPGGGITIMVDVTRVPANGFGYVPTPALVAPIEFTMRREDYEALGGHLDQVRTFDTLGQFMAPGNVERRIVTAHPEESLADEAGQQRRRAMRQQIAILPDNRRLHLQDGPIDLIVEAFGAPDDVRTAYAAAVARFATILDELCIELPTLRAAVDAPRPCPLDGAVAQRMWHSVAPFSAGTFITPMAAVAGGVAEAILAAMTSAAPNLVRAYVNNGGDIALHLGTNEEFAVALIDRPDRPSQIGTATIHATDGVRGIATSGWRGRSFSLGIADAVTILAASAPQADAAATMIANAIDLPGHRFILRVPADELQPDSDLGARLVTRDVPALSVDETEAALARGVAVATAYLARGLIAAASLHLQGTTRRIGLPEDGAGCSRRAESLPRFDEKSVPIQRQAYG